MAMLARRVPYDPARHRALQQHITVTIPTRSGPVVDHAATERMAAGLAVTAVTPSADHSDVTSKHEHNYTRRGSAC